MDELSLPYIASGLHLGPCMPVKHTKIYIQLPSNLSEGLYSPHCIFYPILLRRSRDIALLVAFRIFSSTEVPAKVWVGLCGTRESFSKTLIRNAFGRQLRPNFIQQPIRSMKEANKQPSSAHTWP